MTIESTGLTKIFVKDRTAWPALVDIDFRIDDGEFIALLGPSGCGKTTAMNMIAGLMEPSDGQLTYNGRAIKGPNTNVGYMTQKDSLLPWRTVQRNVRLALEMRHMDRADAKRRVQAALDLVGLGGFGKHYPHQLSGGMRKRVLLARTLVYEPETILMDEPFANLDAQLRLILQGELMRIWSARRPTVVFVTHDIEEAVLLSDRILVFGARPGRIKEELKVDLPRPRDPMTIKFTPEFGRLHQAAWELLQGEYTKGESI